MNAVDWAAFAEDLSSESKAASDNNLVVLSAALVITLQDKDNTVMTRVIARGDIDAMHASFTDLGVASQAIKNQHTQH